MVFASTQTRLPLLMQRILLLASAANGFLAVALGAFGAHGLKTRLADLPDVARRLAWWDTAAHYHLTHALAIALLALACGHVPQRWVGRAGVAMLVGIALFSGSLYAMTLTGITALGAVTPLGGLGLLVGWLMFGIGAVRAAPAASRAARPTTESSSNPA
jgi:uncharacterized membrane protein YgdD (TMEM256/DUF423 family)